MLKLKSINKQSLIDFEETLFMLIESLDNFDAGQLLYIDAIIINSSDPKVYEQVFKEVRTHYDAEVYLKPIFAVAYKTLPYLYEHACDGITDLAKYEQVAIRVRQIKSQISNLYLQQHFPNLEDGYMYKLLQFIYTRESPFIPIANRMSKVNYYFPLLTDLLNEGEGDKAMSVLSSSINKGYLSEGKVTDKIHLCDSCGSAHYNLRETCKSCGSVDLEIRDLVHHFKCAYVGPETDFVQEHSDDLMCPKCHKILRHIGNDYDKPSHIYICNTCDDPFQDPGFTYHCVECRDTKDIHHLHEHKIKDLMLTSKGKYLVLNGLPKKAETKSNLATDMLGVYDVSVFQKFLKQEQARCASNNSNSMLGEVFVSDPGMNVLSRREMRILQVELSETLMGYLNEFEMVTSLNPYCYYFLLIDASEERREHIKNVIDFNLESLIKSNVENSKVEIEIDLKPLAEIADDFKF